MALLNHQILNFGLLYLNVVSTEFPIKTIAKGYNRPKIAYAIRNDIYFSPQDCFLFEFSCVNPIEDVAKPVNPQPYKVIRRICFFIGENKKGK